MDPMRDITVVDFSQHLDADEKSAATIDKYTRDVKAFLKYCGGSPLTKEIVLSYKSLLQQQGYAVRSINSMLASLNSYFAFLGRQELKIKPIRLQQQIFRPEEKEMTRQEYERLCETAMKKRMSVCCLSCKHSAEQGFVSVNCGLSPWRRSRGGRRRFPARGRQERCFL